MSSSEEEAVPDSDSDLSDEDNPILSDESSDEEEEDPERSGSQTQNNVEMQNLNYEVDELANPEIFSVNLHEAQNTLKHFHPESAVANYAEIQLLTRIQRQNGIIVDPNHKTLPILSKYERTKVLGQRAKQIEDGDTPYITINNIMDPYIIASMELEERKIPFIIRRPLPNGTSEYWKLNDLQVL